MRSTRTVQFTAAQAVIDLKATAQNDSWVVQALIDDLGGCYEIEDGTTCGERVAATATRNPHFKVYKIEWRCDKGHHGSVPEAFTAP